MDKNEPTTTTSIGCHIFELANHLAAERDIDGLKKLHQIIGELILAHVRDSVVNLTEVGEYSEALLLQLEGRATEEDSRSLRQLIERDLTGGLW